MIRYISSLGQLWKKIISFLVPPDCLGCQKEGSWICDRCLENLINKNTSEVHYTENIKTVFVIGNYKNSLLQKAIKQIKYSYSQDIIETLSPFFQTKIEKNYPRIYEKNVLVPVPLHFLRKNQRGFNQSEILTQALIKIFPSNQIYNLLKRIKNTPHQATLKKAERLINVKEAFVITKNHLPKNTSIILIDDVCSTGSTLNECAGVLQENGFTNISALVIARTQDI